MMGVYEPQFLSIASDLRGRQRPNNHNDYYNHKYDCRSRGIEVEKDHSGFMPRSIEDRLFARLLRRCEDVDKILSKVWYP